MSQLNYKKEVLDILNNYSNESHENEAFINEYIKNSYIGFLDKKNYQIKEVLYFSDVSIMTKQFLTAIIKWLKENKNYDLVFYRESTIHNQTFNRKMFPYENFVAKYSLTESELYITLRDNRILYNENCPTVCSFYTNKDETNIIYVLHNSIEDFLNKLI